MFYETHYRHNEALCPDALGTLPAALHSLNAAVDDCRRAGKSPSHDASILLLIRNLADVAERDAPSMNDLRLRCAKDRLAVLGSPALLDIAGNDISGDAAAKRTFHYQARRALKHLLAAIGFDPDAARINTVTRAIATRAPPSCATPISRSASFRAGFSPKPKFRLTAAATARTSESHIERRSPSCWTPRRSSAGFVPPSATLALRALPLPRKPR